MSSLQKEINIKKKGDCLLADEKLIPCGYHLDRIGNSAYKIDENISKKVDFESGTILATEEFKRFSQQFLSNNKPPAGGWYLVKEQRDWLKNALREIIEEKISDTIRILEAGAASYIHHFSYLTILKELITEIGGHLNLEIMVVDRCIFPLLTIDAINRDTFRDLKSRPILQIKNYEVELDKEIMIIIEKEDLLNDNRISVNTRQFDLTEKEKAGYLGRFDIITEHHLTAVIENFDSLNEIRKTYSEILATDGYLLCACGITRSKSEQVFEKFRLMHEEKGLRLIAEERVWDPYGMPREKILSLLSHSSINTVFDNTLFKFKKVEAK